MSTSPRVLDTRPFLRCSTCDSTGQAYHCLECGRSVDGDGYCDGCRARTASTCVLLSCADCDGTGHASTCYACEEPAPDGRIHQRCLDLEREWQAGRAAAREAQAAEWHAHRDGTSVAQAWWGR